jgi:hypothetical protein
MARVASNVTVGSKIVTVVAKDADAGKNAQVSYRIVKVGTLSKIYVKEKFSCRMEAHPSSASTKQPVL